MKETLNVLLFSLGSSAMTTLWFGVDSITIPVVIAGLNTATWVACKWVGEVPHRRKVRDTQALLDGFCPVCSGVRVEVTSQNTLACQSCRTVYHTTPDGLVFRVRDRDGAPDDQGDNSASG